MGGWNPLEDIRKGVEGTAKQATQAVTNITRQVGSVANTATRSIASVPKDIGRTWDTNRSQFERSDVGRATRASTVAVWAPVNATAQLARGDVRGAASTLAAGTLKSLDTVGMVANSSSSVDNFMRTKEVNNFTLGWSNDAAENTRVLDEVAGGREINASDVSTVARYSARSIAYGTGGAYLLNSGRATQAVNYLSSNPLEAATFAQLLAQGRYGEAVGAIVGDTIPILGPIVREILSPSPQEQGRAPASDVPSGFESYTLAQSMDLKTKILIGAVVFLIIGFLTKRFRK